MTDAELQSLYALRDHLSSSLAPPLSAPADAPQQGFFNRLGRNVGNWATDIPSDVGALGVNLASWASGAPREIREESIQDVRLNPLFNVPQQSGWQAGAANVLSGVGKSVLEAAVPGGIVTRGASALGAGATTAAILGDVAGGAALGLTQSPQEGALQGGEFGLLGAANRFIPSVPGRILANAAIPVAGQLLRGQNPLDQQSLINTATNVAVPAILGQYGRRLGERSAPQVEPTHVVTPDGQIVPYVPPERGFQMPGYERPGMVDQASEPPQWINPQPVPREAPAPPLALPGSRQLLRDPQAIQTGYTPPKVAAWEGYEPSADRRATFAVQPPAPRQLLRLADQSTAEHAHESTPTITRAEADDKWRQVGAAREAGNDELAVRLLEEARAAETALRSGGLARRSDEAGSFSLSNPAFQYLAGASGGALAGPLADQDRDKPLWQKMLEGAVAGTSAVAAGRGLLRRSSRPPSVRLFHGTNEAFAPGDIRAEGITRTSASDDSVVGAFTTPDRSFAETFGPNVHAYDARFQKLADLRADPMREFRLPQFLGFMRDMGLDVTESDVRKYAGEEPAVRQPGVPYAWADGWAPVVERMTPLFREKGYDAVADSTVHQTTGLPVDQYAALDPKTLSPVSEGKPMLRRRSSEAGALNLSSPATQYAIGAGVGAIAGPVVDQDKDKPLLLRMLEGAAVGAGAVGAAHGVRRLLQGGTPIAQANPVPGNPVTATKGKGLLRQAEEAAVAQERGAPSKLGSAVRILEQNFNLGKSPLVGRAEELGKGKANELREQALPLIGILKTATDPERKALLNYETTRDRTQLLSSVRPEVANAMLKGEGIVTEAQKLIGVHGEDASYRTTKYPAFVEPEKWRKTLQADPSLRQNYVDQIIRDNEIPGASRADVEQAVDEYAADILRGNDFSSETASNSKIGRDIFMGKKELSPEHRAFLDEYKDPAQRLAFTFNKVINSVAQGKKIATLSEMGAKGELPIMTMEERQQKVQAAQQAGDHAEVERLGALQRMPTNKAFGALTGKFVGRDVLDSMNAHNELWTNGWLKNFSGPTSVIKGSMTVANPATHFRQWAQTPMLAAVGRVAPWDFFHTARVFKARGAEYAELIRNHIIGADFSSQDLARGATQMDLAFNPTSGDKALGAWRTIKDSAKKWYGMPDNLLRATVYMKRKPIFFEEGNKLGLKGDELNRYAEGKAMDWTNRYTMNYGQVANAVKVARETPFVSPFISYQSEMLRLLKNLGEDALKGNAADRTWALANISGLIAVPLLIEQFGKSQLSDQDAKEWDRANKLSPSYASGQIRVPLGRNKDGSFKYINIGNLVPAGDSAALARNLVSGEVWDTLKSNPYFGADKTPVFNLVGEISSGRDAFTDRKIDGAGDWTKTLGRAILPPLTPGIGYAAERVGNAFTRNEEGGLGITNARTGQVYTPGTELLRNTGIPVGIVQPRQLLRRAQSDQQEKEGQIKAELRQTLLTNASAETKQTARQEASRKLLRSREEYRQQVR